MPASNQNQRQELFLLHYIFPLPLFRNLSNLISPKVSLILELTIQLFQCLKIRSQKLKEDVDPSLLVQEWPLRPLLCPLFLKQGDHCIITDCSYGGTNRLCRVQFEKYGIEFSFVDFRDLENIKKAIKPNTKLIFSETPANPVLSLCDLEGISKISKENGIIHCCDATFATPVMVRPLDWGCDLTMQSLTKFYDGHNVGTGGAVIAKDPELLEQIKLCQNMHGNIMAPSVAFNILQTMKSMGLRVRRQSATATEVAEWLATHPKVKSVCYPGTTHPQKELADKYHRDGVHGAMLWFDLDGGVDAGIKLMNNIERPWSLCENLGATESIITACAVMTHANMIKEDRLKVGITDGFIRVSCGIEDPADLIRALERALEKC